MAEMFDYSKKTLFGVGTEIADEILKQKKTSSAYLFKNPECLETDTKGWAMEIGGASEDVLILEVWLDSYAQLGGNRFYAGFRSNGRNPIKLLIDSAPTSWKPESKYSIRPKDVHYGDSVYLKQPLTSKSFGKSIHEMHAGGETYLGFYDPIDPSDEIARLRFVRHAVNFFLDIIRARYPVEHLPISDDDYSSVEEKRVVRSHLVHERNRNLADKCKRRDGYRCQVCGFVFEMTYGKFGELYAESHHMVPLCKLEEGSQTYLKDLITVCANCHRMLHRMDGEAGDIDKLRSIVQTHCS